MNRTEEATADPRGVTTQGPGDGSLRHVGQRLRRPVPQDLAVGLSERTERRRVRATAELGAEQAQLGQFFTPELAAGLIASLPSISSTGTVRILDPGAGVGSLSVALICRLLVQAPELEIELVCVELDQTVSISLKESLADIEATGEALGRSIRTNLVSGDYIDLSTGLLGTAAELDEPFDIVIMNPPYGKLAASSRHRKALLTQGVDAPNLYAAFLALGVNALGPRGQLVAITPRSFANGTYFTSFRRFLLAELAIDRLHVFESRSTVFADTGVLQETIVFSGTRNGPEEDVILTVSRGHTDRPDVRVVPYSSVVDPADRDQFIRIPTTGADDDVVSQMATMPAELVDLNLKVSTGKVVDFRATDCLTQAHFEQSVPLIYPGNITAGRVEWPKAIGKSQGLLANDQASRKLLLPSGNYVLVKRFSAKEERRRLVAGVWLGSQSGDDVAFENHLNVFHCNGHGLDLELAVGLSYWLNSTFVDTWFRTFSGHTQVNASDLKKLRFPTAEQLRTLGAGRALELPGQDAIDGAIEALFATRSSV